MRAPRIREQGDDVRSRDMRARRPIEGVTWQVPSHVWVDGDLVRWRVAPEDLTTDVRANPWVQPSPSALRAFLSLGSADEAAIEAYARHYGVLRICRHGLPATHPFEAISNPLALRLFGSPLRGAPLAWRRCTPLGSVDQNFEPISCWRSLAHSLRMLLDIGGALYSGKVGPAESWKGLLGEFPWESADVPLYLARSMVGGMVEELLAVGDVRVEFRWVDRQPTVAFGTNTLVGALSVDLALVVANSDGFAFCSECGRAYIPLRKPVGGKRRYCTQCRRLGVPLRDAQRDQRQRRRSAPGRTT
jgi:hypothetical protein